MKNFLIIITLFFGITAFAQVGIGTTDPEGVLDLVSTDGGIVIPRVANTAAVVNQKNTATTTFPIPDGTMVYDISASCIKAYEGGAWSACFSAGGSDPVPVRSTNTNDISASDLNGYVIITGNISFDISVLSPSANVGDTITLGSYSASGFSVNGADLASNTVQSPSNFGIGVTYVFDGSQWFSVSAQ